jgi:uncharacterized protein
MAVIAVWKCDRDGAMFENKKDAEAHDKMLELAEGITQLLRRNIEEIDEEISREVGLVLARRSDDLAKACKGKTEALLADEEEEPREPNVAPLVAQQ